MTLLFLILLIFKVHWYSIWLALFVDSLIVLIVGEIFKMHSSGSIYSYSAKGTSISEMAEIFIVLGVGLFAFYKLFCGLTISPWFILLAPLYLLICLYVPGGLLIGYQLFVHFGLMTHKLWVFILTIVFSVVLLIPLISWIKDMIKGE